jgi:amidohydrolase
MELQTLIDEKVKEISQEIINLRRVIHENPELGLETYNTAEVIASSLRGSGIPFTEKIGKTGVVALIKGANAGPCILLRADMDALPLTENTGFKYTSKVEGKMHACGHDLHAAALAGIAKVLWHLRDHIKGTYKLMFQPGEETLNGAVAMIEDGILENPVPQMALGFHNWPPLDTGIIAYHPVVSFAGSQAFSITLTGLSGHGAHPHTTIDTITAAANFIMQLQTVVSREIAPVKPAVISVGRIEGGTAENIIAETVNLYGTMRAMDPMVFASMRKTIERLLDGLEKGMRVKYEVSYGEQVPPLINDKAVLAQAVFSARSVVTDENVVEMPEDSMGAEDFAYVSSKIPSAHLRIGSKIPGAEVKMIHRPDFSPDENFLSVAMRLLSRVAIDCANGE